MAAEIIIVDYGMGNLNSVLRALNRIGCDATVSASAAEIARAAKILLPGVGHFKTAMSNLKQRDLVDVLNKVVLEKRIPILGICLGMELMAARSEEGGSAGLGWLDAEAIRLQISDTSRYKLPHMGWNTVRGAKDSLLMRGIGDTAEFYFAHGYHLRLNDPSDLLCETEYETTFASGVERENIFGVQYHPEKSHDDGERLLKNFIEL